MSGSLTVKGQAKLNRKLKKLSGTVQRKLARPALTAAAKPIIKMAKAKAPVETGLLRLSIGAKTKVSRVNNTGFVVIGPRRGFKSTKADAIRAAKGNKKREPANYGHLVEFGTASGARPRPFMRPAFERFKGKALETIAKVMWSGISKEARR